MHTLTLTPHSHTHTHNHIHTLTHTHTHSHTHRLNRTTLQQRSNTGTELSVRSVVREILTSRALDRPKFNYNSIKTLMVKRYGSNAFERVKPVVGKSHTHYISRNESITYQTMTQYQSWRRSQEFRKTHSTSSRNCLMWRVRYLSWIKSWRD